MVNTELQFFTRILLFLTLFLSFPAQADEVKETVEEKEKRQMEWEECFKEEEVKTGSKACFDACRKETGVNEHNWGARQIKDAWIKCQYKKKCGYYKALSQQKCDIKTSGRGISHSYFEKMIKKYNLTGKEVEKWHP